MPKFRHWLFVSAARAFVSGAPNGSFQLRIAFEQVDELLGLDHRVIEVGFRLNRHEDRGPRDPRAESRGVVGKVVQDAQPLAHVKHRHARPECQGPEISHPHRPNPDAELCRRVQLIQHERRSVARRPRRKFHAVGEHAGW
jgi:hypothetical protein